MPVNFGKITLKALEGIRNKTMANARWQQPLLNVREAIIKPIATGSASVPQNIKAAVVKLQTPLNRTLRKLPKTRPWVHTKNLIAGGAKGRINPEDMVAGITQPAPGAINTNAIFSLTKDGRTIMVLAESADAELSKQAVLSFEDSFSIIDACRDLDPDQVTVVAVLVEGNQVTVERIGNSAADVLIHRSEKNTLEPVAAPVEIEQGDALILFDSLWATDVLLGKLDEYADYFAGLKELSSAEIITDFKQGDPKLSVTALIFKDAVVNGDDEAKSVAEPAAEEGPLSFRVDKDADGTDATELGKVDPEPEEEPAPDSGQSKTTLFTPEGASILNLAVRSTEQGVKELFQQSAELQKQHNQVSEAIDNKKAEIKAKRAVINAALDLNSQQAGQQDSRDVLLRALLMERDIVKESQDAIDAIDAALVKLRAQADTIGQQLEEIGGQLGKLRQDEISFALDRLTMLANQIAPKLKEISDAIQSEQTATTPSVTTSKVRTIPARTGKTDRPPPSVRDQDVAAPVATPKPAPTKPKPAAKKKARRKVRAKRRAGTQAGLGQAAPAPAAAAAAPAADMEQTTVRTVEANDQESTSIFAFGREQFSFEKIGLALATVKAENLKNELAAMKDSLLSSAPALAAVLVPKIDEIILLDLVGEELRRKLFEAIEDALADIFTGGGPLGAAASLASIELEKGKDQKRG